LDITNRLGGRDICLLLHAVRTEPKNVSKVTTDVKSGARRWLARIPGFVRQC
jgi:hypothetical protein